MKVHWLENVEFQKAFDALSAEKQLPIKAKVRVARTKIFLTEKVKEFVELRVKFLEEAAKKNENGEAIKHADEEGRVSYTIREEAMEELRAAMSEIADTEIFLPLPRLCLSDLGELPSVTSDQVMLLIMSGVLIDDIEEGMDMTGAPPMARPLMKVPNGN
jgi:hypothetical protein